MTCAAATQTPSTRRAARGVLERRGAATQPPARAVLGVASVGYLVPRSAFDGSVHSVFAHACNLASEHGLLTVCASGAGNGPTVLRLASGAPVDLRDHFEVGERFDAPDGALRTGRIELDFRQASVWRPAAATRTLPCARIEPRLRLTRRVVDERRARQSNVLDTVARPVAGALGDACRTLDREQALRQLDRLVGWGEGLTPAGDDFLVGLLAGLEVLARGDARRLRFQRAIGGAVAARTHRTTPIAAHCLRLAAAGHHGEPLLALRDALVCAIDDGAVEPALRNALAVGATSGADTASGLLAGLFAWLAPPSIAAAA